MSPKKTPRNILHKYIRYSQLGLQMVLVVVILATAGYYLDQKLSLHFPIFMLVGILLGSVGVFIYLVRKYMNNEL